MIPIDQTRFGMPHGNCLPACVASILHLSLDDVPPVCDAGDRWLDRLAVWLRGHGLAPLMIAGPPPDVLGEALCIVSGKSPRGDFLHATVWRGRKMVHDPHPSRAGIGEVADTLVFVPLDPRPVNTRPACLVEQAP